MNKISRELIQIATQLNRLATNFEVDKTQHSFEQLSTWIISASQEVFQEFLNKNNLNRQNLKRGNIGISLQKDKINVQVQFESKNHEKLQIKEDKIEKTRDIYKVTCYANSIGTINLDTSVKTDKFLPLLRSVPESYNLDDGNLTNEAVSSFKKALFTIIQEKYK